LVKRLGADKFNELKQKSLDRRLAKLVELRTGEYISKLQFNRYDKESQDYLMRHGVDKFNKWAKGRAEAKTVEVKFIGYSPTTDEVLIKFPTGKQEWRPETDFPDIAKLTEKQKTELVMTGQYTIPDTRSGKEIMVAMQVSGDIPKEAILEGYDEKTGRISYTIPPIASPEPSGSIWTNIGSSIVSYLKKQFVSPDIPSQTELKKQYNDYQKQPLWAKLLFGINVVRDPKADEYYQVVLGEPPLISPAGSGIRVGRTALKTIEINWNKLVSPKVIKPQVNWNELTKAIGLGKVRSAEEAARWAASQEKYIHRFEPTLKPGTAKYQQMMKAWTEQGLKDAADAATKARTVSIGTGRIALIPQPNVPVTQWKAFTPSQLTVDRMKSLINAWRAMTPSKAIQQMSQAGLITIAIASDPSAVNLILSKVSAKTKAEVLSSVSPNIAQALKTNQLAKAQTEALTQTQTQLGLQTMTQQATELASKLQTQGMTQTKIQEQVATKLKAQLKVIPASVVKTQLQQAVKTISETITKITLQGKIPTIGKVPTITPPTITLPDGTEHTLTEEEWAGSVGWKHGFIYKLIFPPYGKNNITNTKKPIAGIKYYEGARSAYLSITRIGGKVPKIIERDMGIMDIKITTPRVGKPKIAFKPDIRQRTTLTRKQRRHKPRKRGTEPMLITTRW